MRKLLIKLTVGSYRFPSNTFIILAETIANTLIPLFALNYLKVGFITLGIALLSLFIGLYRYYKLNKVEYTARTRVSYILFPLITLSATTFLLNWGIISEILLYIFGVIVLFVEGYLSYLNPPKWEELTDDQKRQLGEGINGGYFRNKKLTSEQFKEWEKLNKNK